MLRKLALVTLCASSLISAKQPLMINGIVAGSIAYWATKAICYGTAGAAVAAGTGTIIAASGPAAPLVAAATANIALPAAAAAPAAAAVTAAIGTSVAATEFAAMATVSTVASSGGIAGGIATIESAATTMGYIFTCIPWLP